MAAGAGPGVTEDGPHRAGLSPRWFVHANVNTADLARAERFYTDALGLVAAARTAPSQPQDGTGFAMPGRLVRWEGVILADRRAPRGPLVDLLEWKEPPTEGSPGAPCQLGIAALRFAVANPAGTAAAGTPGGAVAQEWTLHDQAGDTEVVLTTDPDGTRLELGALPPGVEGPLYRGVRVNCSDLDVSVAFWTAAFGLDADPARTVTATDRGGRPAGRWRAARVYVPGQRDRFCVELTQWDEPEPSGAPPAAGNHAGLYRVAMVVADIEAHHRQVLAVLPSARPPVAVTVFDDQPPLLASFYPDPDGVVAELIQPAAR